MIMQVQFAVDTQQQSSSIQSYSLLLVYERLLRYGISQGRQLVALPRRASWKELERDEPSRLAKRDGHVLPASRFELRRRGYASKCLGTSTTIGNKLSICVETKLKNCISIFRQGGGSP